MECSPFKLKFIIFSIFLYYALFVVCFVYVWNNLGPVTGGTSNRYYEKPTVYIVGKAAIGQYLWHYLLSGEIQSLRNNFYVNGNKTLTNMNLIYLSGPGYIQTTIPQDIEFLVLVLNGRTPKNVNKAEEWLNYLPLMSTLKRTVVVLLGDEMCNNEWILKHMKSRGGVIDILFVVYDAPIVDDKEIFQWPLGVATYRGFPVTGNNIFDAFLPLTRKYICNFIGTVYKNSSREFLIRHLMTSPFGKECHISFRNSWIPQETTSSLRNYVEVLKNSELTLCPVGKNTECYRIYEAFSLGSVPIIEDKMTYGNCVSPLRLLKKYNAPAVYVNDWSEINQVLLTEKKLSMHFIFKRRKNLMHWYKQFKRNFANDFLNKIYKLITSS